jgi:GMP synthase (glutamine-hydrolysing)
MSVPVVLVVQPDPSDPVGPLGDWLQASGVDVRTVAAWEPGALDAGLDGAAGLIVLGGGMNCLDDDAAPWLPGVRALLRDAVAAELPTLGICLGAQLLAVANGGRVEPSPDGPEYGAQLVAKRAAASSDPLLRDLPITPDVLQWHVDAITRLPAGAVLLASSPTCEVQAFRLGRLAWGIQFHIETTPEIVRAWAAEDADALDGYDVATILARSDAAHADIEETWRPFAAAFAAAVRAPGAIGAPRTVPTTTAAPVTDPAAIRAALAAEAAAANRLPGQPASLPMPGVRDPRDPYGHD